MEGEGEGSHAWRPMEEEGEGSHAWRSIEGEGEGSHAWRPMEGEGEGSHVWWLMEGEKKILFTSSHFPSNQFLLKPLIFPFDLKVLLYHGSRPLLTHFLLFLDL